jgi:CheY-like chemotaxis protein
MLAVRLLSQRGAEVAAVEDGEQALEALAQREHDLVLMDIQMPAMDGIQATRAIRSGQAEGVRSDIPIIAVTAHAMKGDAQRCLEAGMNRYLSKPLDLKRLMAAIQCVLEQDAAGEAAAQPAANSSPTPLLEVESTLARMENDKDLHQDILQAFLDDGPSRVHEIRTAWDQGDAEGLRRANHTLRGAAVNVGALRLVEATQELSLALQEDFHAARPAMDRLFEVLEQTQARVREHMGAS